MNTAPGPDNICGRTLRHCAEQLGVAVAAPVPELRGQSYKLLHKGKLKAYKADGMSVRPEEHGTEGKNIDMKGNNK